MTNLPVGFDRHLPVLVKRLQPVLRVPVPFLGPDGFDRVAPGGGLAEQVLQLGDLLLEFSNLAFDVGRLAVGEFPLGLLVLRLYQWPESFLVAGS